MQDIKLMFVEDDIVLNMAMSSSLEDLGFDVRSFYSASSAIEAIDECHYITALLTDIDLGKGLDGFDVARHARKLHRHLPVVFISGTMAAHYAAHAVPGSVLLAKPCQPQQVARALGNVIRLEAA